MSTHGPAPGQSAGGSALVAVPDLHALVQRHLLGSREELLATLDVGDRIQVTIRPLPV
jgi:hypothetical protein